MRQGAPAEAEGDALALNVLLAHTRGDLRDVDLRALGSSGNHLLEVVVLLKRLHRLAARLVACLVEGLVDLGLERLTLRHAGLGLELAVAGLLDDVAHCLLGSADDLLDLVESCLVGHAVADAD